MEKSDRVRLIVRQVLDRLALRGFVQQGDTKRVSDGSQWYADIKINHALANNAGTPLDSNSSNHPDANWNLIQLYVYEELRMTALFRGNDQHDVVVRLYVPGAWEPIFTILPSGDTQPWLPDDLHRINR